MIKQHQSYRLVSGAGPFRLEPYGMGRNLLFNFFPGSAPFQQMQATARSLTSKRHLILPHFPIIHYCAKACNTLDTSRSLPVEIADAPVGMRISGVSGYPTNPAPNNLTRVEAQMVRHKVYTTVTTKNGSGEIIRDRICIGGRREVTTSEVVFNVDADGLSNARVWLLVDVDENDHCTVIITIPAEFELRTQQKS